MPDGGAQARADQRGTLEELAHRHYTSDEVGKLLGELTPLLAELDPAGDEAGLIRAAQREYDLRVRVPAELMNRITQASSLAIQVWQKAKAEDDFPIFEPHLEKLVDLRSEWAACFDVGGNPYDALVDRWEQGLTYAAIAEVFAGVKPPLVELVEAIVSAPDTINPAVLQGDFDTEDQLAFSREVTAAIGYDYDRGRLDTVVHPFSIAFSPDDVRITTHLHADDAIPGLMSSIHEAGHAMYEQNIAPRYYRTVLADGASMSIHESQSRFYENIVGRSRPFWRYWYPRLQEAFPAMQGRDFEAFYRALNRVQPTLLRFEADEVTYGLHIILRFELENDLFNGRVRVKDLPREWNERMETYLGLVPATDAQGVLQDVHWAAALFGYFPDYLLGSMWSVQLWNQMQHDIPDVLDQIGRGEYGGVKSWLDEKVHRHGRKFTLPELSERVVGGPLDWRPYMDYLKSKYGEVYGL
jgi:carboxypeptidase Taq